MESKPQGLRIKVHPFVVRLMNEYSVSTVAAVYQKAYHDHGELGETCTPRDIGYSCINYRLFNALPLEYVQRAYQHHFGLMT